MNKPPGVLARYHENGSYWSVTAYDNSRGALWPSPGHLEGDGKPRPGWLEPIVTAGKIGGHGVKPAFPPPDFILWFRFDPTTNQLISFGRD